MRQQSQGFSIIELMIALTITLGIGMIVFQLFFQNERVFRDQGQISEMQQTGRFVATQIADEIRMAGQGIPVYASTFDTTGVEGAAVVLDGSNSTRINVRAGVSNSETSVTTATPVDYTITTARNVTVGSAQTILDGVGSASPSGRYVYIWGSGTSSCWGWVRALINTITVGTNTINLTPAQSGDGCKDAGADTVLGTADDFTRFTAPATLSLEESVAFFLNSGSIWRTTASSMTNQTSPTWNAASELAQNVTGLTFTYYDENGNAVTPNTLANRLLVARVDVRVVVQTADPLSNGSQPTFALTVRSIPRNVRVR